MQLPIPEKSKKIAISVLKGYTFAQVGSVFGMTGERARQITTKVVHRTGLPMGGFVKQMRQNKYRLIAIIQEL